MTTYGQVSRFDDRLAATDFTRASANCSVREFSSQDLLPLLRANPSRYPFFLESAADGTPRGRYDILFAFPGEQMVLDASSHLTAPHTVETDDFLAELDRWWSRERVRNDSTGLPFRGGWFLLLGYELAGQIEPTLNLHRPHSQPIAIAVRVPAALVRDRQNGRLFAVAESGQESLLDIIAEDVGRGQTESETGTTLAASLKEDAPEQYLSAIERTKRYIVDGDIFQANLSRAWCGKLKPDVSSADLYNRLRRSNPGSFAGLAVLDDMTIMSSSPERLLEIRGDAVQTRPIAGTRPRGHGQIQDRQLSRELITHPKERAEHIMLIDLERNDLGRICQPGSIAVSELMVVESYAHVHHIVSNVRGKLREGIRPGQAIRAVFPGGTITGCPKVRCMEIINELEAAARGPYTGSMGYLNRDGSLDLNILIRTMVREGDVLSLRAGGGIVADSDPEKELAETRSKAKGMIKALDIGNEPCG